MGTLNFPCGTCGAIVSTVGLAPGRAPMCSGCGRAYPEAMAATPLHSRAATSGLGAAVIGAFVVVGAVAFVVLWGVGQSDSRRLAVEQQELERAALVQAQAAGIDRKEVARLAEILGRGTDEEARAAWTALASWDARDHWGTFEVLEDCYARADRPHAVWWLSNGFLQYYGDRGEAALAEGLVRWQKNEELFEMACTSLEQYPVTCGRDQGPSRGLALAAAAQRVLRSAEARVDHPRATPRLETALGRLSRAFPAESR
ncbi:MAG: hypothetical protein HUU15_08930 [Candidatus Brocadiae bacterium]|nr:hypothetical protein [Candidatus Brocadiia bacterium]